MESARQWDPQPFHIDIEFSRSWNYGGLIASGLHTMSPNLRLWRDLGVFRHFSLGSPGLGETHFPRPARPPAPIRVIVPTLHPPPPPPHPPPAPSPVPPSPL